ncbi:MAG: SGNH/GDSL hydrolase family protein, partial [Candidatus Wallbacteria bacterium]|nr:SGNH/GDSL hydrolase family protein [Candidatus Wallbacteria bacterium]
MLNPEILDFFTGLFFTLLLPAFLVDRAELFPAVPGLIIISLAIFSISIIFLNFSRSAFSRVSSGWSVLLISCALLYNFGRPDLFGALILAVIWPVMTVAVNRFFLNRRRAALLLPLLFFPALEAGLRTGGFGDGFQLYRKSGYAPFLEYSLNSGTDQINFLHDSSGFRIDSTGTGHAQPETVAFLGDSTVYGWGVSYQDSFIGRLSLSTAGYQFINAALPGAGSKEIIKILPRVAASADPDVYVISCGVNDAQLKQLDYFPDWKLSEKFCCAYLLEMLLRQVSRRISGPVPKTSKEDHLNNLSLISEFVAAKKRELLFFSLDCAYFEWEYYNLL